mmetsp:Transcript_14993/g.41486  ORF Transcript_14993/g.41486 Transcript_14993/m.41486 type:complete len:363 (-) Transcript_14993:98-1186(-)
MGTLLLPPNRLPMDCLPSFQHVLAGAPLLPGRRHDVQRRGLPADRDGGVLAEGVALQAHPDADHLVRSESRMDGLAVDHASSALEAPLSSVTATDDPHAIAARVQPAFAANVLPERLAIDHLVSNGHVLTSTPLLPVWGQDVERRGLDADHDGRVLMELAAIQAQPHAADLVRHDATVRVLAVNDAFGASKALLLGIATTDDPRTIAARVEPRPSRFLLPHGLPVGYLPNEQDVLSSAPLLSIGRDDAQGPQDVEVGGDCDFGVLDKCLTVQPEPDTRDVVGCNPLMQHLVKEHASRAVKLLLLRVLASNDPHAIVARVKPEVAPGLLPERVAIGAFLSEEGVLPRATLLTVRRDDIKARWQ